MKSLLSITILFVAGVLCAQVDTRVGAHNPSSDAGDTDATASQYGGARERESLLSGVSALKGDFAHDRVYVSAQVSEVADSNSRQNSQGFQFGVFSQFGGQLQIEHSWRQAAIVAEYTGGASAGGQGSSLAQNYHEAGLTQTLSLRRWNFLAAGHFTYLPESSFGFNALRAIPGVDANLNTSVLPDQTIVTQSATQLNETVIAQAEYSLNRLSSVTLFGVYSRQNFDSQALLDNNQINATLAYNHVLSVRSTVAVSYSFGQFAFDASPAKLQTHSVQLSYGHRLGPRMNFRVAAGPQLRQFQNTNSSDTPVSLAASADLDYQLRRTHLDLGYSRQTTAGSGVLVGSLMDQVVLTARQDLGRLWHAGTSISYAHNGSLNGANGLGQQQFNAVYATVRVDRNFGRSMVAFASYGAQIQNSSTSVAAPAYSARHVLTIGLTFHRAHVSSQVATIAPKAYGERSAKEQMSLERSGD